MVLPQDRIFPSSVRAKPKVEPGEMDVTLDTASLGSFIISKPGAMFCWVPSVYDRSMG